MFYAAEKRLGPLPLKGETMRKLTLTIAAILTATAVGGGVYAGTSTSSCNYNEDGTYTSSDGTVSAFGTMNAAMHCAAQGLLPQIVADRLGVWGDADTREWAEEIRKLDAEQKQKNKKVEVEKLADPLPLEEDGFEIELITSEDEV